MKTVLAAALVGSLAGGACSGETDTPADTSVTITFLRHDNPDYVKADEDFFAAYKVKHTGVTVKGETIKYPSLAATLLADLKSDKLGFDLVRVQPSWVCSFADNLTDVPADVLSVSDAQNTFFAAPLAGATCNGKLKGLPIEYNLEYGGVVINMDKWEAKFGARKPGWDTWEAFIADAAALTEYEGDKPMANGLDIAPEWPQPVKHIFFSQILQRGGRYWNAAQDALDLGTPEAHEALATMVGWVTDKKVMYRNLIPDANTFVTTRLATGATGYGWGDPAKPLSVMGYVGTWGVPSTVGQMPPGAKTRYEYFTLPPMVGTQHRFVQNSGWALVVPKTSKNARAAWDLAKSLTTSGEAMRKWASITGALPALKVNGTKEAAAADPQLAKVQPLLEQGQWVGYIPATAIETVEGTLVSNFFEAVSGKKTIDEALASIQQTANEALKKNR
jgi:multiple sugar transport system substrate-binding protein